jgi:hypothetical protein
MRIPRPHLAALVWLSTALAWGRNPVVLGDGTALTAQVRLPQGTYYAGQLIPFEVIVTGGEADPSVELPKIPNVHVFPNGPPAGGPTRPDGPPGEGVHRLGFRIVAERPGALVIPPLVVRSGDQITRTGMVRRTVRAVPPAGRSAAFLGGVGTLDVEAAAEPATVTAGRTIEYRIILRGGAAFGTSKPQTLLGLEGGELGVRVESRPVDGSTDPDRKVFRWLLRPTRPGKFVIPPQPVGYFDPNSPPSARFQTKWTRSVPIEVRDVARFDPSSLGYSRPTGGGTRKSRWLWGLLALLLVLPVVSWFVVWARKRRVSPQPTRDADRIAADLARRFAGAGDEDAVELAQAIGDSLSEYLSAAGGRPRGALTPAEAGEVIGAVLASPEVARQAAALIERCDWVCYSGVGIDRGRLDAGESKRLADAASNLFEGLARKRPGSIAFAGRNGAGDGRLAD